MVSGNMVLIRGSMPPRSSKTLQNVTQPNLSGVNTKPKVTSKPPVKANNSSSLSSSSSSSAAAMKTKKVKSVAAVTKAKVRRSVAENSLIIDNSMFKVKPIKNQKKRKNEATQRQAKKKAVRKLMINSGSDIPIRGACFKPDPKSKLEECMQQLAQMKREDKRSDFSRGQYAEQGVKAVTYPKMAVKNSGMAGNGNWKVYMRKEITGSGITMRMGYFNTNLCVRLAESDEVDSAGKVHERHDQKTCRNAIFLTREEFETLQLVNSEILNSIVLSQREENAGVEYTFSLRQLNPADVHGNDITETCPMTSVIVKQGKVTFRSWYPARCAEYRGTIMEQLDQTVCGLVNLSQHHYHSLSTCFSELHAGFQKFPQHVIGNRYAELMFELISECIHRIMKITLGNQSMLGEDFYNKNVTDAFMCAYQESMNFSFATNILRRFRLKIEAWNDLTVQEEKIDQYTFYHQCAAQLQVVRLYVQIRELKMTKNVQRKENELIEIEGIQEKDVGPAYAVSATSSSSITGGMQNDEENEEMEEEGVEGEEEEGGEEEEEENDEEPYEMGEYTYVDEENEEEIVEQEKIKDKDEESVSEHSAEYAV